MELNLVNLKPHEDVMINTSELTLNKSEYVNLCHSMNNYFNKTYSILQSESKNDIVHLKILESVKESLIRITQQYSVNELFTDTRFVSFVILKTINKSKYEFYNETYKHIREIVKLFRRPENINAPISLNVSSGVCKIIF